VNLLEFKRADFVVSQASFFHSEWHSGLKNRRIMAALTQQDVHKEPSKIL
jgi:hypothetical protein